MSLINRNINSTDTFVYSLNTNNLVVASFACLLVLLLLAFILGVMYICAKLRRGNRAPMEVGDTEWVHSSFNRNTGGGGARPGSAAATADLYRSQQHQSTGFNWSVSESLRRRGDDQQALTSLAMNRPAFFSRAEPRASPAIGSGAAFAAGGASSAAAGGQLVRAALPTVSERAHNPDQPRCLSVDDNGQYDQLRMQRLALSGPFVNENAGSSDSLAAGGNPAGADDLYRSEEYLDVLGVKK